MAYLMPGRSPSLLGAYRRDSPVPVLPQQRVQFQPARFSVAHLRRFHRPLLGQDTPPDYTAVLSFPPPPPDIGVSPVMSEQITAAVASIPSSGPAAPPGTVFQGGGSPSILNVQPTNYPPIPAQIQSSYTQQPLPSNPLSYASPQAAIAAGQNPQAVYTAWTQMLARYPTQQAAVAAGIPAGVVTQLWAASRSAGAGAPAGASWLDQSTFGIPNKYLVFGVGGIALLAAMGGKGRR